MQSEASTADENEKDILTYRIVATADGEPGLDPSLYNLCNYE